MARLDADLSKYQAQGSFDPLPPGDYTVTIYDTEIKQSRSGNNMVKVTLKVTDGALAGRMVWDQYVLGNEVAMKRLKSLAVAGKHPHPDFIRDTDELHGLNLGIRVKIEDKGDGYGPKNVIMSFKSIDGSAQASSPVSSQMAVPPQIPQAAAAPIPHAPTMPPTQQAPVSSAPKMPWD